VEYIASCQHVDGGFGPPGQISYLNYTSMAIFVLGWLGELGKISIEDALDFILDCYVGYGFGNVLYPEDADIISTWYGVRALKYLGRLDLIDVEAIKNYALSIPWETTVTMALAIDILFNLNFLDVVDVDSVVYYLTSNPPEGVNYIDVGFLNTPYDEYPNIISTWAGIKIMSTLGHLDAINGNKVSRFIIRTQNSDGGFRDSEYSVGNSRIDYTFYAVDSLRMLGNLDNGNMPFAALYSVITANTGGLGDVLYALLTLQSLEKIMIPLEININATTVSLGDKINISLRLVNVYGEEIDNALTMLSVGNITAIFSEASGCYGIIFDTRDLDNGTYNATITSTRDPYIKFKYNFSLIVLKCMYIGEIYYGGEIIAGQKTQLTLQLTDRWGQPILGAEVKVKLQGREFNLDGVGGGIYVGNISADFPEKNGTMIIRAQKQGYYPLTRVYYVTVKPPEIKSNINIIPKAIAYGLILLAILVLARSVENGFISLGYMILLVALMDISGLLSYVNTDLVLMGLGTSIILFSVHEQRQGVLELLGLFICVGIMGLLFGYAAYFLGAILFLTASLAYMVAPGERNLILRDLAKCVIGWTITLISLSAGFMFLENPFTFQGRLAPPAGIGMSFAGYVGLLWYSIFIFIPIITASKFAYIIAAGLRLKVSELYRRITGEVEGTLERGAESGGDEL